MIAKSDYKEFIKIQAHKLGFSYIGFSKAEFLKDEAPRLEKWLKQNMHGQMHYMQNYFDVRLNPTLLLDNAKTVITLMFNYFTNKKQSSKLLISKYAYGNDYHFVLKHKLKDLLKTMQLHIGNIQARVFVDSAPVLEKAWALKSGVGWMGKNGNIINKKSGSFFFLAEIITDLQIEPDGPVKDYCGTCKACIDACPTEAIVAPQVVDGSKCISYYTIELKEALEKHVHKNWQNWIFGCDICQDVCPWNRFATRHNEPLFEPKEQLLNFSDKQWHEITEDVFKLLFKNSAVKRTKYNGFKRNIDFVLQNQIKND
ncbi:MAG: tRNA epoxyqueuosine(34) reductase QueG [Bacteroidia bacterium]